jgi:pyruvate kinase
MHDIDMFFFKPSLRTNGDERKTKITATIGPASESEETLSQLITAGMDFARFNTKHGEPSWHLERIQRVRKVASQMGKTIPILLDLQGPEVRITVLNGDQFDVKKDEEVVFTSQSQSSAAKAVYIPQGVIDSLHSGDILSIGDGACELRVTNRQEDELRAVALDEFTIKTRKTLNTPGVVLDMPSLLDKDIAFLDDLKDQNIEMIALSFVRDMRDIAQLRQSLAARGMNSAIVSKIENRKAIENIDEIIQGSDVIMVARGDLGIEMPYYEVPHWQKAIIKKCKAVGKPVITATQMLLSMTASRLPTRAEVSDVANAVYDGTTSVMLSEESAQGSYPVKAVAVQEQIISYHEQFVYGTKVS